MRWMFRICGPVLVWLIGVLPIGAEAIGDLTGLEAKSRLRGAEIGLPFSGPVAWRAYVTADEPVLVITWQGEASGDLNPLPERRFGSARLSEQGGWSRLAIPMQRRMTIAAASLDQAEGWRLSLRLRRASQEAYDAVSLSPTGTETAPMAEAVALPRLVVIDAGHGGRDPGAVHGGLAEKNITLDLALRLEAVLSERGVPTLLTREDDRFISLDERVQMARGAGASLLISLHADAFDDPAVSGSSVYTLSQASVPDEVADDFTDGLVPAYAAPDLGAVLTSLARRSSLHAADQVRLRVLQRLETAGIALNRNPVRHAGFRVLQAPDVPSLLIEFGYMSNATDRARLADPAWRARAAEAVAAAIAP